MQTITSSNQTDAPLTINLRTLALIDIFSQGWRLYWKNFPQILPIALIIYLPMNLLRYLIINPLAMTLYAYAGQLLELAFSLFGFVAVVGLIEGIVRGQPLSWRAALPYAWSRWDRAIGTMFRLLLPLLGWALLWLIGSLFLIFFTSNLLIWPLVFLLLIGFSKVFVDYGFWLYVVALGGRSGADALAYSKALTTGHWWSICGCQLAIMGALGIPLLIFLQVCNSLFHSPLLLVCVTLLSQLVSLAGIAMGVLLFLRTEQQQHDAGVLTGREVAELLTTEEEEEFVDDDNYSVADAPLHTSFTRTGSPRWFALTFAFGASLLLLLLFVLMNG
jgi:hypothetical protein